MRYKLNLAVLMFSIALITVPGLSVAANAHEEWNKDGAVTQCHHEGLSESKKDILRIAMKKTHEQNKATFEALHKLKKEQHAILAAQTFNKEAFLAVESKIQKKRDELQASHIRAFASVADKFTPEEREHIMRRLSHHHPHHHHGQRGWRHGEERQGEGRQGEQDQGQDSWQYQDWHKGGNDNDAPPSTSLAPTSDQGEAAPTGD